MNFSTEYVYDHHHYHQHIFISFTRNYNVNMALYELLFEMTITKGSN